MSENKVVSYRELMLFKREMSQAVRDWLVAHNVVSDDDAKRATFEVDGRKVLVKIHERPIV